MLCIGSGDTTDRAEITHAVGRNQCAEPAGSCVSVGCVRSIEFVAASYPLHAGRFSELLQKFQVEVSLPFLRQRIALPTVMLKVTMSLWLFVTFFKFWPQRMTWQV